MFEKIETTLRNGVVTVKLDASALAYGTCLRRFNLKIVEGWQKPATSVDMVFGSAVHTFLKVRDEKQDDLKGLGDALTYWSKSRKSYDRLNGFLDDKYLTEVCMQYAFNYSSDDYELLRFNNGKPFVEQRVFFPYYKSDCGRVEVVLCGTIDAMVRQKSTGFLFIKDYKTTRAWDIPKYFTSYNLSTQLMMYKMLITFYAELIQDSIISQATTGNLGCFIDGIFLGKSKPPHFQRSEPFYYDEERLQTFQNTLNTFIEHRLVPAILDPRARMLPEGMIHKACVFCEYSEVCASRVPEMVLMENFVQEEYDPMTHGDLKE